MGDIISKFDKQNEIPEQCQDVYDVDFGESVQTNIRLQSETSDSIQPRTSPLKFASSRRRVLEPI